MSAYDNTIEVREDESVDQMLVEPEADKCRLRRGKDVCMVDRMPVIASANGPVGEYFTLRYAKNTSSVRQMQCLVCGERGPSWCASYPRTVRATTWCEMHRHIPSGPPA